MTPDTIEEMIREVRGPIAAWRAHASCAKVYIPWSGGANDPWFPSPGGSEQPAKRICAECPVRAACLADALATGERGGIRGGLSPRERRRLQQAEAS